MSIAQPATPEHSGTPTSLRSRKRAATRLAICHTAIELGLTHGYDNVTVDMICAASDVSPRTFFNYFGNKEGAYMSPSKPQPTAQQHQAFVQSTESSVFEGLFTLIAETFVNAETDLELFQARHQLIQRTPDLLEREKARLNEVEDLYVGYVLERFHYTGRTIEDTPDLDDEARMIVALVSGALRFALQKWSAGNFTTARESLISTTAELVHRITANEHWP